LLRNQGLFPVAKKSRAFSSLPYSADKKVCRSWEGAEPGSQPKLASGNIPYHGCHALVYKGELARGQPVFVYKGGVDWVGNPRFHGFKFSLVWEFRLLLEVSLFQEFHEIHPQFLRSMIAAKELAVNQSLGGEKNCMYFVLHIHYYHYYYHY